MANDIFSKGIAMKELRPEILALKGMYFTRTNNEVVARELIRDLEAQKGKYDFGNAEMQMAVIETWLV